MDDEDKEIARFLFFKKGFRLGEIGEVLKVDTNKLAWFHGEIIDHVKSYVNPTRVKADMVKVRITVPVFEHIKILKQDGWAEKGKNYDKITIMEKEIPMSANGVESDIGDN